MRICVADKVKNRETTPRGNPRAYAVARQARGVRPVLWMAGVLAFLGIARGATTLITLPSSDFVGGRHVTFYLNDDATFGDGYSYKAARKVAVFPRHVEGDTTEARFDLDEKPAAAATLRLTGLDDPGEPNTPIRVSLNDTVLHDGATTFKNNPHEYRTREWSEMVFKVPAAALLKGRNVLRIENRVEGRAHIDFQWMYVHEAVLELPGEIGARVIPGEDFLGRHYLEGKIEPIAFPAVLKDNVLHLTRGYYMQHHFTFMVDGSWGGKKADMLIEIPKGIAAEVVSGTLVAREAITREGKSYERLTLALTLGSTQARRIAFSRYPRLALRADTEGDLPPIYMRFKHEETLHPERAYRVHSWPGDAGDKPKPENFFLGIWGGGKPENEFLAKDYGRRLKDHGFGMIFGTTSSTDAEYLHRYGIKYYSRFGPHHPSSEHPSIGWDGKENPRRADPIHLIYDPEAVSYPTFQRGIAAAKAEGIDGVCCDYEIGADSWSDRSIAEFKAFAPRFRNHTKEELIALATDPETGNYKPFPEWTDYWRWLNARIVGRIQREMRKVKPDMPYLSLASASDMPCYWWNADKGRFRLRDLVDQVSEIAVSVYHYDNPGGLPSIPAIVNRARRFAVGKDVGVHLIGIWGVGTLIELYRYGPVYMRDWQMRMDILLAATAGARAFHFFSYLHVDGQYMHAAAQAMADFASIEAHIQGAVEADDRVKTAFIDEPEYTLTMSANPIFGQKLLWHGEPEMQTYQMLRIREDGKLVLLLFNFMDVPARQTVSIAHTEGQTYRVSSLLGPAVAKDTTVMPAAGFEWTTAPQDVHVLLLEPVRAD